MTIPVRREPNPPPEDPTRVTAADLQCIGQLSALLSTLNDPRAGADALARHVTAIPVLQARISARFARDYPNRKKHGIGQQIALLGNRVLESILLELLEDVITLHSEVEPRTRYER
jgi:hypothetical protein